MHMNLLGQEQIELEGKQHRHLDLQNTIGSVLGDKASTDRRTEMTTSDGGVMGTSMGRGGQVDGHKKASRRGARQGWRELPSQPQRRAIGMARTT
jgi:hypothetical protein